jgi:hypothetical protein
MYTIIEGLMRDIKELRECLQNAIKAGEDILEVTSAPNKKFLRKHWEETQEIAEEFGFRAVDDEESNKINGIIFAKLSST